jgi:hypothetical protein
MVYQEKKYHLFEIVENHVFSKFDYVQIDNQNRKSLIGEHYGSTVPCWTLVTFSVFSPIHSR